MVQDDGLNDLIAGLEAEGCSVLPLPFLPIPGKKTPTGEFLLVGHLGLSYLFLYKDQAKRPSGQVVTPTERDWLLQWKGIVHVVETLDQAMTALRIWP